MRFLDLILPIINDISSFLPSACAIFGLTKLAKLRIIEHIFYYEAQAAVTQVFIFSPNDTVRVLEIPQHPESIARAVNHGEWQPYLSDQDDLSQIWQARLAGKHVIISPAQTLPVPNPIHLTPRENQVLQLLVSGHTPAQIALSLHLTERSIRRHLEMLRRKFHAQTLMQVLAKAVALGMARRDLNDLVD